jgi:cation-transporting ATPase E
VLAEGRRVVGNIERVAHLFLIKTGYALVLALLVAVSRLA